jgi:hypothetical protein
MKIDKFRDFNLGKQVGDLLDKCKTQELRDIISKKYNEYLDSTSDEISFIIEDYSKLKFDVELEEDFGENIMVYYDTQMQDWMLGILEPSYAELLSGWNWSAVTLKDGKILIITYFEEDNTIICGIYDMKNLKEGQVEKVYNDI